MADAKVDGRRTFASGAKVRIIGLDSRPELNGILGEVVGPLDAGRYPVRFLSGGGGAKVKMENLRIGVRAKPKLYPGYESLLAMARAHDFLFYVNSSHASQRRLSQTPSGAGGPVSIKIDEEERKRIPLPRNVKKLLAFVLDNASSDGAKLECFKSLQGHAESSNEEHHRQLFELGIHTTAVKVLDGSTSDVVKGAAGGVLQNLAMLESNVDPLLAVGVVPALTLRLAPSVHPLGREGAADCLLNLCATPAGKAAIVAGAAPSAAATVACLVALASEPPPTRASAQATAMAVLGCCLQEPSAWEPIVVSGGLDAAVCMLHRTDTTAAGRERAVGLIFVLATALEGRQRHAFREAGCFSVLHAMASATQSGAEVTAKARETAAECMSVFAQRGELTASMDGNDPLGDTLTSDEPTSAADVELT